MSHKQPNPIYLETSSGIQTIWPQRYPGGELRLPHVPTNDVLYVHARAESADDIMALTLLSDALEWRGRAPGLVLPYMPYARQDRRSEDTANQTLSVRVMARLLNAMCWATVRLCDPHSTVTPALIERAVVSPRRLLVVSFFEQLAREGVNSDNLVIVSPDLGAMKESTEIASQVNAPVVCAYKSRDAATGKIKPIQILGGEAIRGKHVVVCDDICDGGGTFVGLAEALAPLEPLSLNLYVTHGIFSKGVEPLQAYDRIFSMFPFLSYEDKIYKQSIFNVMRRVGNDFNVLFSKGIPQDAQFPSDWGFEWRNPDDRHPYSNIYLTKKEQQ